MLAPLTEKLANKLFDFSGGIPAYIIKIFQESQAQALLQGQTQISEKILQRAIDILAIKVPRTYSGGTYISDFEVNGNRHDEVPVGSVSRDPSDNDIDNLLPVPRLYANQRGRKAAERGATDGFGIHAIREKNSIDTEKLRQYCMNFYGKAISEQYFSKLSPAVLYRLFHWKLTSPERYALMAVLTGLSVEELFGSEIRAVDLLLQKFLEYQDNGAAYKKEELAKLTGINAHQLDALARKYHLTPC